MKEMQKGIDLTDKKGQKDEFIIHDSKKLTI